MSDKEKTLLNEATVRRFMNLAGTKKYTDNFITESTNSLEEETIEEEKLEEQFPGAPEEDEFADADADAAAADALDVAPADEFDDVGDEAAMDPSAPADEANIGALVSAIADTITQVTGVDVDVTDDVEGEEGLDLAPDEFDDEGAEGAELAGLDMGAEAPGEEELAALQEAFINELTGRVTARVQKEQIVETVMRRVAKRLQKPTKKG